MSRRLSLSVVVIAVTALAAVATAAPAANAAVNVKWDCYGVGRVGCSALESAFFSNKAYARVADDKPADVDIKIRSLALPTATRYLFELHGKQLAFHFDDTIPVEIASDGVLLRLVGDLDKLTAPLFLIDEPATYDDAGLLHFALRDPREGPRLARSDDETTGWYLAPGASLDASLNSVLTSGAHAWAEINWSNPRWRLHGWAWGDYGRAESFDDRIPKDERVFTSYDWGTSFVAAHSFFAEAPGFTFTAQAEVETNTNSNYELRANTYVGAEWVLVPFLKVDEGNAGVQYVIGAEHQQYFEETVLDTKQLDWLRHRLSVFAAWHFKTVDLDGRGNFESMVNDLTFTQVSASASATWHLLDDLSLSLYGEAAFRNALVNEPKAEAPPLAQFYGGDNFGALNFYSSVSISYVFGNSLLLRQDQRWK